VDGKRERDEKMNNEAGNEEARALFTIGSRKKKNRLLKNIALAKLIDSKVKSYMIEWKMSKTDAEKELGKRFGVSETQIRHFRKFLELPESVQKLFDPSGIETAYEISKWKNKEDIKILEEALTDYELARNDVRDIVRIKRKNPAMQVMECISLVLESRPIIKLITGIPHDTLQALIKASKTHKISVENLVEGIIRKILPSNSVMSFEMRGGLISISLKKEGFRALKNKAKELKIRLRDLADILSKNWLGAG
jgi:hypothetical protein